jgi:hypothetical protein
MICAKRVEEFSKTSVAGDPDEFQSLQNRVWDSPRI